MRKKKWTLVVIVVTTLMFAACGQTTPSDYRVENEMKDHFETIVDKEDETLVASITPTETPVDPMKQPELATVFIVDGKEYDLSRDFQEVVGRMTKDGINVVASGYMVVYDEEGKMWNKDGEPRGNSYFQEDAICISAREHSFSVKKNEEYLYDTHGYLIRKEYDIEDMKAKGIASGLGISLLTDVEKKLDPKIFWKVGGVSLGLGSDKGYMAIFVNGRAIDLSKYEDRLEELKNYQGNSSITVGFFPHREYFGQRLEGQRFQPFYTYEDLRSTIEKDWGFQDADLLMMFALEDVYQQLEDKKIERFSTLSFGIDEEDNDINMIYKEFYFDKTWSFDKFSYPKEGRESN